MKKIFFPHLLMLVRVMAFVHSLYIATSLFSSIFFYEIAHFISSVVTKISWNNSMDSNRHCNKPLQKPTCVVLLKSVLYIRWSFLSKGFNIQIYYLGYRITHRPAAAKVKINGNIHWYHTHISHESSILSHLLQPGWESVCQVQQTSDHHQKSLSTFN